MNIVITAGPTREYLDTIRFLSNPSSGKMGFAIARAARQRGHHVTLVTGPVELPDPPGVRVVRVVTGREMSRAARAAFQSADAAIFAAAVCDYRPHRRADRKLAKSRQGLTLTLRPTEDIAAGLGRIKGDRITIVFALEDRAGRAKAARKLIAKRADGVLLNAPATIGAETASIEFLQRGASWQTWPAATKRQVAARIIRTLEQMQEARMPRVGRKRARTQGEL